MKTATVLNFNTTENLINTEAGLAMTIRKVIELKLKSLTARARLACENLTTDEADGLEKQAMHNFLQSQKVSTPVIEQAIAKIDNKGFQTFAIQIAVQIGKGNFDFALELFEQTVESFSEVIDHLFNSEAARAAAQSIAA